MSWFCRDNNRNSNNNNNNDNNNNNNLKPVSCSFALLVHVP